MLAFIAFWVCSGLLGVPGFWAYWCRKYPTISDEREELGTALLAAVCFGPVGTFTFFFLSGFYRHGLKFKFGEDKERGSR